MGSVRGGFSAVQGQSPWRESGGRNRPEAQSLRTGKCVPSSDFLLGGKLIVNLNTLDLGTLVVVDIPI